MKEKMGEGMILSVIIPVYNTGESYLVNTLDSVLGQTYPHLEIIIIDDGSEDNSFSVCERYAQKDARIRLFKNEKNIGTSVTRNKGMEKATGSYLAFMDSDDIIASDMYEKMLRKLWDTNSDMVICDMAHANISAERTDFPSKASIFVSPIPFCPVNKLYKKALFIDNNIRYPKGIIWEDTATIALALGYAKKIVYVREKLYTYVHRSNSITKTVTLSSARIKKSFQDYFANIKIIQKHYHIYTKAEIEALEKRFLEHLCQNLHECVDSVRNPIFIIRMYLYISFGIYKYIRYNHKEKKLRYKEIFISFKLHLRRWISAFRNKYARLLLMAYYGFLLLFSAMLYYLFFCCK